jgi:flagellar biogenesis protein FliO
MTPSILVYGTAIAVVALVLYGVVQVVGRRLDDAASRTGSDAPELNVIVRTRVGIGRSLVVVDVEGRRLLLGSTRQQWTALADLGEAGERLVRDGDSDDAIETELARAIEASRQRRGGRRS